MKLLRDMTIERRVNLSS